MSEIDLAQLLEGAGPLGVLALIAWAELRVLPHVRTTATLVRANAKALGVNVTELLGEKPPAAAKPS